MSRRGTERGVRCARRPTRQSWQRRVARLVAVSVLSWPAVVSGSVQPSVERVVDLRVHGNQSLSDEEVLSLSAVAVGDVVDAEKVEQVERRLQASGHFESVEVRKRYLSLTATDEVALVFVVRERTVTAATGPIPRVLGEVGQRLMFLPIFDYTEGYGFTYGVQTSVVDVLGDAARVSMPATWGGTKRVALEVDQVFSEGIVQRLQGGVSRSRRENPHFQTDDDRTRVWARVDRRLPAKLRVAAEGGWADVRFGTRDDTLKRFRVLLEVDTRRDVSFPRDALFAQASFEWLDLNGGNRVIGRPHYRAEAYKGLVGQSVLALRADYWGTDRSLPAYEQPMLGGGRSLRGWKVGEFVGDRSLNGSAELRFPLNSPLSIGRMGGAIFFDTGTVYNVGQALGRAQFHHGAGVGVFLRVPFVHLQLDVAHNLEDRVRVHVAAAVTF